MSIAFVLRRDLGAHVNISRNLGEGVGLKFRRLFWCAVYTIKAFWLGFVAMRHEQLGSTVEYQGRRLRISNWANSPHPTLAGKGFYQQNVPRAEIKNIVNVRELYHRFVFGFSFFMGSWHSIYVQRRLYKGK